MLLLIGITFKIVVVASVLMGAVAYLIYVERKVAAFAQDRIGPNRAGGEFGVPFGLLQPLADGAKMLLKEGVVPTYVNKPLYILAPVDRNHRGPGRPSPSSRLGRSAERADRLPDRPGRRHRHPLHFCHQQPGGLRRDPGRMVVQ